MNSEHAMAIVCDLALCIGREVTQDALFTKVLQRLLFHTAYPTGAVLQQHSPEEYRLLKVIGDEQLGHCTGELLHLPDRVWQEESDHLPEPVSLPCRHNKMFAYRLRIEPHYLILLSARADHPPLPPQLFKPVLGNLARAIQLCQDSELLAQRQQAELLDMQRFNESLLKAIPIPVFYKDIDGRFLGCNPAFTQMTGISKETLRGKRSDDFFSSRLASIYRQRESEMFANQQPQRFEETMPDLNGQLHQVINVKDLFYDHQGQVAGIIGALVDITQLKESEQQQRQLLFQTIAALSSAIAHKDLTSADHEQRVHDLALAMAQQLQLPQAQQDGLGLAAMVHNIGLLQTPTELLTRPRELRPIELALIQQHPQTGYDILKQIDFPWPIATIVQQHHENLDGSGYPFGLTGDEICLEARIIRVADSLIAMTSHRPFRRAMTLPAALAQLTRHSGIKYDKQVVDSCLALLKEGYSLPHLSSRHEQPDDAQSSH